MHFSIKATAVLNGNAKVARFKPHNAVDQGGLDVESNGFALGKGQKAIKSFG